MLSQATKRNLLPPPEHAPAHWRRLRDEAARLIEEVPLYAGRPAPPASDDPHAIADWLATMPTVSKRELRRGFPKSLVRRSCDMKAAMQSGEVEIIATSGTTENRLQVLWQWSWWDPQEREAMRLNSVVAAAMAGPFREAVLTTPVCGGSTCHIGSLSLAERTVDGMLFLNQVADPSLWNEAELARMVGEWNDLAPVGVEADPLYLAALCRFATARGQTLAPPAFVTLTYEQTTRAARRAIAAALPGCGIFNLYGATEAGVPFMECTHGRLHHNAAHSHVELLDIGDGLSRVIITTLGRTWMPLLRYDIGDLVRLAGSDRCGCGRGGEGYLLQRIEGRANDAVEAGGRIFTPAALDDLVDGADPSIVHWQLQGAGDGWLLQAVGSDDGAVRAASALAGALGVKVEPRPAPLIQPEASGKYRIVRPS